MNIVVDQLCQTIRFCDRFMMLNNTVEASNLKKNIDLLSDFRIISEIEEAKLPYHINIVDLLRANEPAHSKILGALLQQQSSGVYEVLSSFYTLLHSPDNHFELPVSKPKITVEKDRIDVCILDRNYAIIIENKIHNAIDQPSQLGNYIEKIKTLGYPENSIYVLYLIRDENKRPDSNSWKGYEESFKPRFRVLSYRNDILPWLKEIVLPGCRKDNVVFKGAIEQYIDHLDGMFSLRTINDSMNKELQEFLKKELGLEKESNVNHSKILNKLEEIEKLKNQLFLLKDEMERECWADWLEQLKRDYPDYPIIDYSGNPNLPKVGVVLKYKGHGFSVLIEKNPNKIYYGFGRHDTSDALIQEIIDFLPPVMGKCGVGGQDEWWYGWRYTSFEEGFGLLKKAIDEAIVSLNQ